MTKEAELIELAPYLEEADELAWQAQMRQEENARILHAMGKRLRRKAKGAAKADQSTGFTPGKIERARTLARRTATRALRKADGNPQRAMQLLWAWSRTNTALQNALIVMSIEALTE